MVSKHGRTVLSIMEHGRIIYQKEMEYLQNLMVIYFLGLGVMEKSTGMPPINKNKILIIKVSLHTHTRVIGNMVRSVEKDKKSGLMEPTILVYTLKIENMVRGN